MYHNKSVDKYNSTIYDITNSDKLTAEVNDLVLKIVNESILH